MPREDLVEIEGVITEALGGGQYKVEISEGEDSKSTIRAKLAGKLKLHKIRVIPGDTVTVGVSPYDLTHGIITYRGKSRR